MVVMRIKLANVCKILEQCLTLSMHSKMLVIIIVKFNANWYCYPH